MPTTIQTTVQCSHCELPVPAGLIEPDQTEQFCCGGCDTAYQLIYANGLDAFYAMADGADERSLSDIAPCNNFSEYDEPVFHNKFARQISPQRVKIELAIEGMHCAACIWLIEKLPQMVSGVTQARVNWSRRTVSIEFEPESVQLSKIAKTLQQLGYRPTPFQPNQKLDRWKLENRRHLARIGVAAACAGNNMMISAALYLGMFAHMTTGMAQLMRISSALVGIVALIWPGRVFLTSAWAAIRTRTAHMDLPIAIALFVGTLAGLANVIRDSGEIYFDSLAVLIFLLLIGRWLQFRQQTKAASAVELLQQLTPRKARKLVNGQPVEVLVDLLKVDDLVLVRSGDLFPADGQLLDSNTMVDESVLTGESAAVEKVVDDLVFAGTTNTGSVVKMRVNSVGDNMRIKSIVDLAEQGAQHKPEVVLWANRIGGYFVAIVVSLAIYTFAWWAFRDIEIAIDRTVALLVVACPCALALATPLAIAVSLGRAARQKIMIKGGDVLQLLQKPGTIWLDKTGTLTEGDLRVARWYGDRSWLLPVSALEEKYNHPVARAIVHFRQTTHLPIDEIDPAQLSGVRFAFYEARSWVIRSVQHASGGVSGAVGVLDIDVGNQLLMESFGIPINNHHRRIANRIASEGYAPCWIAVDARIVAIAALSDTVRRDTSECVDELKRQGWRVGIISGDHQAVVDRVAKRLNVEPELAFGQVTPEEKLAIVRDGVRSTRFSQHPVIMVGDGVNDSAALAAADVGIAVKSGAEASLAAAPVYLAKSGLKPILQLLAISRATGRTMRLNLGVSLAYNLTFAALAFVGYINPLVAAILMPISSITVVALSMSSGATKSDSNREPIE